MFRCFLIPKDDIGWTELSVRCSCGDNGHTVSFGWFDDDETMYISVLAVDPKLSFLRRCYRAIRQVFKWHDEYRTYVCIDPKTTQKVIKFLNDYYNNAYILELGKTNNTSYNIPNIFYKKE